MAANDNTPTDLPLAVAEAATLYMVHTDHLGRPTRMTDSTKATVWAASYKAWGEPTILSGTKLLNLRFPGQYFQIETGLAYNWNRHYDTTTGRYTQPDPLRFVDGPAIYTYAGSSPWMRTDRNGLWTVQVGLSGSVELGPFTIAGGFGFAVDGHGNFGGYWVGGGGGGVAAGGSLGIAGGASTGQTICDLGGPFINYGGNIGAGADIGGEYFTGYGQNDQLVQGGGVVVGAGVGGGGFLGGTLTTVRPFNSSKTCGCDAGT
jgi:RHS repeat-associated protein